MYKLTITPPYERVTGTVKNAETFIPFEPLNAYYQQFKEDLANGVELQDADGATMTAEAVTEFLKTLP